MNISCPLPHLVVKTHPKQAKSAENLQVASLLLVLPTFLLSGNFGVGGVTSEPKERKMDLALSPSSSSRWPGGPTCGMTVAAVGFAAASALVNVLLPWLEEEEGDPKRLTAAKEVPNLAPSPYCVKKTWCNCVFKSTGRPICSWTGFGWFEFFPFFCLPNSAWNCCLRMRYYIVSEGQFLRFDFEGSFLNIDYLILRY